MSNPRVAIIGCGLVGEKRMKLLAPGTVTVVCDLNLERAKKLAALTPGCEPRTQWRKPSRRRTWIA